MVWEVMSEQVEARLEGHTGLIRDVAVSAALNIMVSTGYDRSIKFWV